MGSLLLFMLILAEGLKEGLVVMGADQVISTSVGEEVILNCSVNSQIPVHQLEEVKWTKVPDIPVLLFKENRTFPEFSSNSYLGRVDFFTSEIPEGNFSLRLRDVGLEDKGKYVCDVHATDFSGQTTVFIQEIGFSSLQMLILVLCFLSLALALGVPALILLQKQASPRQEVILHILLIFCPNIVMFIAFVLWSTEGYLSEVVICAAVSLARCLMLMKTSPSLNLLPERWVKEVKTLSVPLHYIIIVISSSSVTFHHLRRMALFVPEAAATLAFIVLFSVSSLVLAKFQPRIFLFLCLEQCNGFLFIIFLTAEPVPTDLVVVMVSTGVVVVLSLSLQRYFFQQKLFTRLHVGLMSVLITLYCGPNIGFFIFFGFLMRNFAQFWMFPFASVLYIISWLAVVFVVRFQHKISYQKCCSNWRVSGYVTCAVITAVAVAVNYSLYIYCIRTYITDKDYSGYLAIIILVHILPVGHLFDHPTNLQKLPHLIIYMFGTSGLSIITAITLATELILKAEKGLRTLPEMHIIILPFETLFICLWIALIIINSSSWKKMRNSKKKVENPIKSEPQDDESDAVGEEMQGLSSPST